MSFDDATVFAVRESYCRIHFWSVTETQPLSTMKNTDLKTKKLATLMEKKPKFLRSFYNDDEKYSRD